MVKKIDAIVKPSEKSSVTVPVSMVDDTFVIIVFKTICNGQIFLLSGIKSIALYQEFQLPTAKNRPIVANIGKESGKKILTNMVTSLAPSIYALSSISTGNDAK